MCVCHSLRLYMIYLSLYFVVCIYTDLLCVCVCVCVCVCKAGYSGRARSLVDASGKYWNKSRASIASSGSLL